MDKFSNITFISLGYDCSVKMYINTIASQPAHLFDWIGSPMWGINKFINNSFHLFNKDDYKPLQIYTENEDHSHMHCNTLLCSNKCIVFIRLEEGMENKVIHENYKNLYLVSELEYVKEFIHIIKNKYPTLKFRVIYISKSQQTELNNDLLILHNNNNTIKEILNKNIELINKLI
jgi:hypothetical protein